jgi:glycine cleavage system aminomethyltransferase T
MGQLSLEAAIEEAGSPIGLMRNSSARPILFPVAPEFTNWRSEQHAWRSTCVLFDQSHHMTDLYLSGPDALRLLSDFGVNSFTGFAPGKAIPRWPTGCSTTRKPAATTSRSSGTRTRLTGRRGRP